MSSGVPEGTRVLINLLPNTAETVGIINEALLNQLADQSYLMNLARGCMWWKTIC
jgi:glyoxylate/hydroxypyruvate reductase A